ncbi:MAG TPA: hypothetical protein VFL59_06235, partial [Candidatus Nanopelagicales bacterium]|nr:hypothetical protein [Candidatus Nanopelagicales bacterium]
GIGERWGENGNTPINFVQGAGPGVTVHVVGGACDTLPWKVQVYETDQLVVLGARPDAPPYPTPWTWQLGPGGCTSNAVDRPVDVVLAAPIGDRLVVQAWSGAPVPQHD